jgi:serine/threonine protein kinase
MVVEYAARGDLLNYIRTKEKRRLDEPEARNMFTQLMGAVKYLEARHILHRQVISPQYGHPPLIPLTCRDLKCENVFLDAQLNVKLGDFGFTRVLRPGESSTSVHFCTFLLANSKSLFKDALWEQAIRSTGTSYRPTVPGQRSGHLECRSGAIRHADWSV